MCTEFNVKKERKTNVQMEKKNFTFESILGIRYK